MVCVHKRWKNVICESDAKNVVSCLNDRNSSILHWSGENLFDEILCLCNSFISISFSWCKRDCSSLAHLCAKWTAENNFCGFISENYLLQNILDCLALEERNIPLSGDGTAV